MAVFRHLQSVQFIVPFENKLLAVANGAAFTERAGKFITSIRSPLLRHKISIPSCPPMLAVGSYTGEAIILSAGDGRLQFVKVLRFKQRHQGLAAYGQIYLCMCNGFASFA